MLRSKIKGAKKIDKKFTNLINSFPTKAKGLVKNLTKETKDLAKSKAPVDTGKLQGGIDSKVIENNNNTYAEEVYINSNNVEYWEYVEFGTGPVGAGTYNYPIEVKKGYTSKESWVYKSRDGNFYTTSGIEAQPYFYPAYYEMRPEVEKRAKKLVEQELKW